MKAFVFRLERLLRLKSRAETEQARMLGEALRAERTRRDALELAERDLDRLGHEAREAAGRVAPAGTLHHLGLAVHRAAEDVEAAAEGVARAADVVSEEESRYREARRERRALERLREQRTEEWQRTAAREEQREQDDLGQRRVREGEGR